MRKYKYLIVLLFSTQVALSVPAVNAVEPNWYAKGLAAEYAADYQAAISHYTKSGNAGVNDASFALGRIYRTLGNDATSFEWFIRAAKAGNKFAQYEVGLIYLNGNSVTAADSAEAMKWFTYSSNANNGSASYELFKLVKDVKWLEQAADQGIQRAMQDLADAYKQGLYGLNVDMEESDRWTRRFSESQEQEVAQ